jgi:hypothetical protein
MVCPEGLGTSAFRWSIWLRVIGPPSLRASGGSLANSGMPNFGHGGYLRAGVTRYAFYELGKDRDEGRALGITIEYFGVIGGQQGAHVRRNEGSASLAHIRSSASARETAVS